MMLRWKLLFICSNLVGCMLSVFVVVWKILGFGLVKLNMCVLSVVWKNLLLLVSWRFVLLLVIVINGKWVFNYVSVGSVFL